MAKVSPNTALGAISGTIDGYVYRRHRGRTVLQRKPVFTQPWTEAQAGTRRTFAGGSQFAATVKADPALRQLYSTRGKRAKYNFRQMAIRDFFHPPVVDRLNTREYTPRNGGVLIVSARDDFEVVRVTVALHAAVGAIVTAGDAMERCGQWQFTVPPAPPDAKPAVRAIVNAFDRPGNSTTKEFPLA